VSAALNLENETTAPTIAEWTSVATAAEFLGVPLLSLRRMIERNAKKGKDGSIESRRDGITARKLGRLWRVRLDPAWTKPTPLG
jgi:hypothetical protein